ncbi:Chaperone protein dnaJ 11, chloroplastic [Sesamum angolense]|uniref:Chaperone protein dnaJ 11, chloroplastic n=1 Tax=Sesamum angolense TaxID=2727404 RepID=A0AAE1WXV2_9LAMI|nr:Chaperone protein dnaJ 11, chloroplastic [Sesamum angolense]
MAAISSLYDLLGIPATATGREIKAAYRRLARTCHPDVVAVTQRNKSATEFMVIHTAYSTLSDPQKRAIYDRDLFESGRDYSSSMGWESSAPLRSGYGVGRNWESDQCW